MPNLTKVSESFNAHSALVRFAQELKEYCHDDVSVIPNVDITTDMISVDAIVEYHGMIVAVIECVDNENFLQVVRRDISKIMKRAQVLLGIVITASGHYYLRKFSRKRSSRAKISTIADEIKALYKTILENLEPTDVKAKLLELFAAAPAFII